jgi:hypothetical protein
MVHRSKCGSVTLLAYCHLRIFIYLVLPERAYNMEQSTLDYQWVVRVS